MFAVVPPRKWGNGWLAFCTALILIGVVTFVVGEVATLFGCVCGLQTVVTAITLVALGTSLPDTFASMSAAKNSTNADSAIGNVTGSNAVNVFLGMGLPWVISATYWNAKYRVSAPVPAGALGFNCIVFLCCALTCFVVLGVRRCAIGGELGGPRFSRVVSAVILIGLWLTYIVLCTLQAYGVVCIEVGATCPPASTSVNGTAR